MEEREEADMKTVADDLMEAVEEVLEPEVELGVKKVEMVAIRQVEEEADLEKEEMVEMEDMLILVAVEDMVEELNIVNII